MSQLPHDKRSFTQGLLYSPKTKKVYESAGLYGQSDVREFDHNSGDVVRKSSKLERKFFAEGIVEDADGDLIMLTWKEKTALRITTDDFTTKSTFNYKTHTSEGWGITNYGDDFIVSDGSAWMFLWDGATMEEKRRFQVHTSDGKKVRFLNELEYYKGDILANIWYSDIIVRIDVESGIVKTIYDFKDLWPKKDRDVNADCFNGIALLEDDVLLVTGKLWPKAYKIKLNI
ncbi:hypothetical protein TL16_g10269 [Triparma laevis f. inornata]|uniref:Glutamine cyclotransferase n=1 Tax=Triparma laevis f. inornata TaxID=1714386 RepID=A0A9W7BCR9_9STRA|nr:hypothetical protein TL16_g10269 [Triparma laevis f. inornata]